MNNEGDRQPTSPEQGPLRFPQPIGEVFAALHHARQFDGGDSDEMADMLYGLQELCTRGCSSLQWDNLRDITLLAARGGEGDDFWKEPKVQLLTEELTQEALENYVSTLVDEANYISEFLAEHPTLVRVGSYDGPYLVGVDNEFEPYQESSIPKHAPARVIAYTDTGEGVRIDTPTQLFIDPKGLTPQQKRAVEDYYQALAIRPFAILDEEKED